MNTFWHKAFETIGKKSIYPIKHYVTKQCRDWIYFELFSLTAKAKAPNSYKPFADYEDTQAKTSVSSNSITETGPEKLLCERTSSLSTTLRQPA